MPAPSKKKTPVKLGDVAAAADVSVATVSMALRNHKSISTKTRNRVIAAQKQVGYSPIRRRRDAAALRDKPSQRQSLLFCTIDRAIDREDYAAFLNGVMSSCKDKCISLEVAAISGHDVFSNKLPEIITPDVKGIILTGNPTQQQVDHFLAQRSKLVVLGNYNLSNVHTVEFDIFHAGGLVAERVIREGHRDVVCVQSNLDNYFARQYLMGIRDIFDQNHIELPSANIFHLPDLEAREIFNSVSKIVESVLSMKPKVSAVICDGSFFAEAFLTEFRVQTKSDSHGALPIYTINATPIKMRHPRIALLHLDLEMAGKVAMNKLCQIIANREPFPNSVVIKNANWHDSKPQ